MLRTATIALTAAFLCTGTWSQGFTEYCQTSMSSSGCQAKITGSNNKQPIAGAADWSCVLTGAEARKPGIFFTSNTGTANIPIQGSSTTLCMFPPLTRSAVQFTDGTRGCTGGYSLIINDGVAYPTGFEGTPGETTYIQAWYRDPQLPVVGSNFSDAIMVHWAP